MHDKRRNDGHAERQRTNSRRVVSCKFGDERFGLRFARSTVFGHFENFGNRRFAENLFDLCRKRTAYVDTAAGERVTNADGSRHGFAGKRGGVDLACSGKNRAVKRNFFTALDEDCVADLDRFRHNLLVGAVCGGKIGIVRTDVHQLRNRAARACHGKALEQLTDLI